MQAIGMFPCKATQKPAAKKWCSWQHFTLSRSGLVMWQHSASKQEVYFLELSQVHRQPSSLLLSDLTISALNFLDKPSQKELVVQENIFLLNAEHLGFAGKHSPPQTRVWDTTQCTGPNSRIQGPTSASSRTFFFSFSCSRYNC